jgi:hypothetical protein
MNHQVVITNETEVTPESITPVASSANPANTSPPSASPPSASPAKAHGQTGPKTDAGKQKAARNALRAGLYAPGVVHEAEAERLQTLRESLFVLTEASDVNEHPMLPVVIESIAMLHIRMARVLGVETQAMSYWYADLKVKGAFCKAAGLPHSFDVNVPDWFFRAVDVSEKREAQAAPRVLRQAKMLFNYAQPPQGLEHAANLADLRAFVHEQLCAQGETMVRAITRHFDEANFAARMRALVSWFEREYAWELRWAAHGARFETIIARLRADAFSEILANDARQKLHASFSKQLLQHMALFEQMRARAFLPQALSA